MKEIGMLFNATMVRALLDGSKVQTRRIVKPAPQMVTDKRIEPWAGNPAALLQLLLASKRGCPYGQPGDRIWVRETHRPIFGQTCGLIVVDYRADPREKWERLGDAPGCLVKGTKWTPSIHMRREYSRILLEIVSVRVERLQDISDADILAEGIDAEKLAESQDKFNTLFHPGEADGRPTLRSAWRDLWESTGGDWDVNEWLWVITFKRVTP